MGFAPAFEVEGIAQVRSALREAGADRRAMAKAHKRVAKVVEVGSRRKAGAGTRQQEAAANVLAARSTNAEAQLAIRNTARVPFGLGAFLGGKRPQFPLPWVGQSWDILSGTGPYAIRDAIRQDRQEILDTFQEEILAAMAAAGLDVS